MQRTTLRIRESEDLKKKIKKHGSSLKEFIVQQETLDMLIRN